MARSNKPMIWLPFAAGGTIAAFVLPGAMLAMLLASAGLIGGEGLSYEHMRAFVNHPAGKLIILVVLGVPLWHAAHRLRMTIQDLGARRPGTRRLVARCCYGAALIATLALLYALWPSV